MQLEPTIYNKGLVASFGQVVKAEGVGALATGLAPTVFGYFIQGWFKFGGVEFFKIQFVKSLGEQKAWDNRTGSGPAPAALLSLLRDLLCTRLCALFSLLRSLAMCLAVLCARD